MPSKKEFQVLQQKADASESELNSIRAQAQESEKKLTADIQVLNSSMLKEKNIRADVEKALNKSVEEVNQLQKVNSELSGNVDELQKSITSLEEVKSEFEALQVKFEALQEALTDEKLKKEALIDEKSKQETSLNKSIEELKETINQSVAGNEALQEQVGLLTAAKTGMGERIKELESKLEKSEGEGNDLRYELNQTEQKLSDRQTLCEDLSSQLEEALRARDEASGERENKNRSFILFVKPTISVNLHFAPILFGLLFLKMQMCDYRKTTRLLLSFANISILTQNGIVVRWLTIFL
jgi:chromosome segregation ATPase